MNHRSAWKVFILLFLLSPMISPIPLQHTLRVTGIEDWPTGFGYIIQGVIPEVTDPFVELANDTLETLPALHHMLNSAIHWVQLGLSNIEQWGLTFEEKEAINALLDQAYLTKYGFTAREYHDQYNTTYKFPVVKYTSYYLLIQDSAYAGGIPVLITRVVPTPRDGYLDWNTTGFGGSLAEPFQASLDNAVAWAEHSVNKTVFYFSLYVRDGLSATFEWAFFVKYGMNYNDYFDYYNATIWGPLVAYEGYFFKFTFGIPDIVLPPEPFPWEVLTALILVSVIGFVVLSASIMNLRQIRRDLQNGKPKKV